MTMELRKFLTGGMSFVLLQFLLGNVLCVSSVPASEDKAAVDFQCSNNLFHLMFCQLTPTPDQSNCTEYSLTLKLDNKYSPTKASCIFERREGDSGDCSCNISMRTYYEETHTATLWKAGKSLHSKTISITDTIKPKTPTITSVKEVNGKFQVMWKKDYKDPTSFLMTYRVTYRKKGEKTEVAKDVTLIPHEINGRTLDPSTKYLVRVYCYSIDSNRFSDGSEEWEFTTPPSSKMPPHVNLLIILSLSVAAVIITSVVFGCYVRFKAEWWDKTAKHPDKTLLTMLPGKQTLLYSSQTIFSPIHVDPPEPNDGKPWSKYSLSDTSSGINSGSSSLDYANTLPLDIDASLEKALRKALPQITWTSPATDSSLKESYEDNGSSFDNKTYTILIPGGEKQPVLFSDPDYHPTEGHVACPDQWAPACLVTGDANIPLVGSSSVEIDFSYQPCNADSGSLSPVSSGINTSVPHHLVSSVEAGCEVLDEVVSGARNPPEETPDVDSLEAPVCNENPCYGSRVSPSRSLPPTDDDYQPFQSLVQQPNILFPEQSSGEQEKHLDKYSEEVFSKESSKAAGSLDFGIPQGSMGPVLPDFTFSGGQCLPELFSVLKTDNSEPVITDSGYHSV